MKWSWTRQLMVVAGVVALAWLVISEIGWWRDSSVTTDANTTPAAADTHGAGSRGGFSWLFSDIDSSERDRAQTRSASRDSERGAMLATRGLGHRIEDLIGAELQATDIKRDPAGFRRRLLARIRAAFPPGQAPHAEELAGRYVDYRIAQGANRDGAKQTDNAADLRAQIEERAELRRRFFSDDEAQALFGEQDRLDRYMLARLEIEKDRSLDAATRARKLEQADAENLSPEDRAMRSATTVTNELARQNADFASRNSTPQDRYQARSERFGQQAAQRLADLDQRQQQWGQRLDELSQARAARANGQLSDQEYQQWVNSSFTAAEQARLDGAMALRDATAQRSSRP